MNNRISQTRTEALTAEYIYIRKLGLLSKLSTTINVLTIVLPIPILTATYITKGTEYENISNVASLILSSSLSCLVILALILKLDQKRESYIVGRRSNIYIANEALKLANEDKDGPELGWFYNYIVEMDSKDAENIGEVSKKLKQEAYRHSLEKLVPGSKDVVCSVCGASPFIFQKGSCQVCGNKPRNPK